MNFELKANTMDCFVPRNDDARRPSLRGTKQSREIKYKHVIGNNYELQDISYSLITNQ